MSAIKTITQNLIPKNGDTKKSPVVVKKRKSSIKEIYSALLAKANDLPTDLSTHKRQLFK